MGKRAQGDYRADPYVAGLPAFEAQPKAVTISLVGLFNGWVADRKPPAKTEYSWKRIFNSFAASVGHDDATRITKREVVKWKDELVADGTPTAEGCRCSERSGRDFQWFSSWVLWLSVD